MNQSAVFVDEKQLKFLKEMDKWLKQQPPNDTIDAVRLLITTVEKKGYYYEGPQQEILNYMREEYIREKKKK